MQDDHPYDMVDTETASLFHRHTHHTGFSTRPNKYYYGERGLHLIEGIPSSYTLFFYTSGRVQTKSYPTSHAGR